MGLECIPNIKSLAWEYFCPVCQFLICPNEALQAKCTHLYCKPCLAHVANSTKACPYDGCLVTETDAKPLMESNQILAYTIGKTVVYCLYQRSGCTWTGCLADSSVHCSGCAFGSSLIICNWCGIQIEHRRHGHEHIRVCQGKQQVEVQESQPIDTSDLVQAPVVQANVSQCTSQVNATVTQEKLYQQQDYRNHSGHYMHQQHNHMSNSQKQLPPSQHSQISSPHQTARYVSQTHSQGQAQPQLHAGVSVPSNSMLEYHQAGPQTAQVQNHLPQQVWHPPSLDTTPKHTSAESQLTNTEYIKQLVRKYGGASSVSQSSAMHPAHQPLSKHSLPQQHQGDHFTNPHKDEKLPLKPHDIQPTSSTDFGEQHGLRIPVSNYIGILHVLRGGRRPGINDIEGGYKFGIPMHLPKRELEGHGGNLQIGKRLRDSDMIGPVGMPRNNIREDLLMPRNNLDCYGYDHGLPSLPRFEDGIDYDSNYLEPGDIVSKYTRQGLPGDVGHFQISRERMARAEAWCRICKVDCQTSEGLSLHFKSEEHHRKTIEVVLMVKEEGKKLKTSHANSSSFSNWKNMEKGESDS